MQLLLPLFTKDYRKSFSDEIQMSSVTEIEKKEKKEKQRSLITSVFISNER